MSNAKMALLAGGVVVLVAVAGGGGFYAGHLSAKVEYLEQQAQAVPAAQAMAAVQPYVAPNEPMGVAPAPVQAGLSADGVPVAVAPVLADAKSAAAILQALGKASAISVDGEVKHDQPIYAFFDPRCPYCKKAMGELNGKANVKWIPVSLLGELQPGADMVEGMKTLPAKEAVAAAVNGGYPKAVGTAETQGQLQDNASILLALYEGAQDMVAVPTILIPRADGTVTFHRGFDEGDGAKIVGAYGS
ncbi:MAG: hypothetical protein ORO03_03675 [Alphaproteobacteria bacterium]|nr:hypothetical protein [Alphaproteobacteria bacterium]